MDAAFQLQFDKLANTVLAVSKTDIDALPEIKGWGIRHFAKIAKMFDSFCLMFDGTKDYVTLCALIRMIYDNWYSFLWIYECSEGEDVQLRYYLYVLDSIKQRKTTMLKMHGEPITDPKLKTLVDNAVADCAKARQQYIAAIHSLTLWKEHAANIKKARDNQNSWRYKDIKADELEFYNWSGLYERISNQETRYFLNYLSQYVHGLYASTLNVVPSAREMDLLLNEAQSLIMSINDYLYKNPLR